MGRPAKRAISVIEFEKEKQIPINELKLDYGNNRLAHLEIKSDKDLEEKLWKQGELDLLSRDIKYRGLQEPLILYPSKNVVAEGNCRLLCLMRLHSEAQKSDEPILQKFKDYKVPCRQIVKGTHSTDIDAYLTEIHVGRKKKWLEYNQAKLLHKLKNNDGLTYEEIARIARSSKPTIIKKIRAFEYLSLYHDKYQNEEEYIHKFYFFWEFAHPDLQNFRDEPDNIIKFIKWVHHDKFPTSKDVRDLPAVLNDKKAYSVFEEKDIVAAVATLLKIDPSIKSSLYKKIRKFSDLVDSFSNREILLAVEEPSRKHMLEMVHKKLGSLINDINKFEKLKEQKN